MKLFRKIFTSGLVLAALTTGFTACNKLELDPTPIVAPTQATSPTLLSLLDDPNYSILKAAVLRASTVPGVSPTLAQQLGAPTLKFTLFAPDNNAFIASGIPSAAAIATLPATTLYSIVSYHIMPQVVRSTTITSSFPNFQYPSILNPAPSVSALLRLTTFPSVRGSAAWVNNVPITAVNTEAVNGVLHKVAFLVAPPSTYLADRINTDAELTYLKAAIQRADSGVVAGSRIADALSNIGANLTVFAPTDEAFETFLVGAITRYLVSQGAPLVVADAQANALVGGYGTLLLSNPGSIPVYGPALASVITPTLAKGIVVYHVLSAQSGTYAPPGIRAFTNNFPTTATAVKTLLNSAVAVHPGVTISATFAGPFVAAATVKGAANATASNLIISAPPSNTHDLHHLNGVLHKIDQVLLPQ
ncbi:MAG: hypothetical protein RLY16_77 [Bacteroidota bacterium]